MSKTEQTKELERQIWKATVNMSTFGCFEVTYPIGGHYQQRVDYLTYNVTKGEFRCYEIKVSLADFRSRAAHTFIGHYNYYVLPVLLYESVKDEIPSDIGVFVSGSVVKKPKRREVEDIDKLKDCFIRSLAREVNKGVNAADIEVLNRKNIVIAHAKDERDKYKRAFQLIHRDVLQRHGNDWYNAPILYNESGRMLLSDEERESIND